MVNLSYVYHNFIMGHERRKGLHSVTVGLGRDSVKFNFYSHQSAKDNFCGRSKNKSVKMEKKNII